mmetsp:Transcript_41716/g.126576  ORF Transcript_41716/g.126576 Transcript_41716/m.126576 type:complete len:223 (-) Transcript_41716:6-674(-)
MILRRSQRSIEEERASQDGPSGGAGREGGAGKSLRSRSRSCPGVVVVVPVRLWRLSRSAVRVSRIQSFLSFFAPGTSSPVVDVGAESVEGEADRPRSRRAAQFRIDRHSEELHLDRRGRQRQALPRRRSGDDQGSHPHQRQGPRHSRRRRYAQVMFVRIDDGDVHRDGCRGVRARSAETLNRICRDRWCAAATAMPAAWSAEREREKMLLCSTCAPRSAAQR